ncbi:MAG: DUF4350 domain-containing protein [Thermoflexales bacterium]|nr:DUF4350 domain-containing protein [Thermoflexales bacterium]
MAALLCFCLLAAPLAAQYPSLRVTDSYDSSTEGGFWVFGKGLRASGYEVERIENQSWLSAFVIPRNTRGLIVLTPHDMAESDANRIRAFVRQGGTLLYNASAQTHLNESLGVQVDRTLVGYPQFVSTDDYLVHRGSQIDCMGSGVVDKVDVEPDGHPTALTTLQSGRPTLVTFRLGLGRVYATTTPCMWSNGRVRDDNPALLTRAIFQPLPTGSLIVFDEYHNGSDPGVPRLAADDFATERFRRELASGAGVWPWSEFTLETPKHGDLALSPWLAVVGAAALIVLAYALLNGRRMGRVLRLRPERHPRSSSDQVAALAGLVVRARDWRGPREHLRARLKRAIGRQLGLDSGAPDAAFVAQVRLRRQDIPVEPLADLLADLAAPDIKRREVIDFDREVNEMIERYR